MRTLREWLPLLLLGAEVVCMAALLAGALGQP